MNVQILDFHKIENELLTGLRSAKEGGYLLGPGKLGVFAEEKGMIFAAVNKDSISLCAIGAYLLGKERLLEEQWRDKEAANRLGINEELIPYIESGFDQGVSGEVCPIWTAEARECFLLGQRLRSAFP